MINFIEKLNNTADLDLVKDCIAKILSERPWPNGSEEDLRISNQIGLRHRPDAKNKWLDASGGAKDNQEGKAETDFSVWHSSVPEYLSNLIEEVAKANHFKIGRVRIMRLLPKTGLMMHEDFEKRVHLVITTNKGCYIATPMTVEPGADHQIKGYHIPADSHFYKIDTTVYHFVYNAGDTERVHLVINCLD